MIKTVSDEFVENLEFNRLSSIYNFNSTIYQLEPTAKVGFIKTASHFAEVALPILSKIKNQELILNDYRLDYGHMQALKEAFRIEPHLATTFRLNNCGLDEASVE